MFVTKTDKAIGMVVEQTGYKKVGVLLTREINDSPIDIEYYSPQWLAENTTNFDKYNSEYVFNLFAEHIKVLGASKEAFNKFMLFAPDDVKKYLKPEMAEINKKYEEWKQKNSKENAMSDAKVKKTKQATKQDVAKQDDAKNVTKAASKTSNAKSEVKVADVKATKTATKNEDGKKVKGLFTAEEVEAIKAVKKDEQLLGKNKSDTARRIVIKYHDTKNDDEMLEIAKKIWTESHVQNDLIKYHHKELIEKGVISA